MLTVKLSACAVIASSPESIRINGEGGSGSDLTKENQGSWGNIWDDDEE